ncbi:MAG: 8-oxo-dGTP diphosphatase [Clostridia bacterium]|nr:8-oxo-dGTP diphosphatase [Clostridia bacterium]
MNTSLVYLEKDGCYLLLHRTKKERDINHDKWIGVGGKFLPGESPDDCARRETKEETGLVCGKLAYRAVVTFVPDQDVCEYMHLFTCSDFTGKLQECNEGDLAWIPKKDILSLPLWEGDKIFLRLLEENHPFFSLRLAYRGDTLVSARLDGEELL